MASIYELAEVPQAMRDGVWQAEFFKELPGAQLRVLNETPVTGPDGWPYLLADLETGAKDPFGNIVSWLSTRGIGLVINPQNEMPDAILTYGMIWNYRQTGRIFTVEGDSNEIAQEASLPAKFELHEGQAAHAGAPTEEYLPKYVQEILRSFFHDNGVSNPRVLVMSTDRKNYDLCFSLEALGNPDASEHQGILEALSWFLPAHYSLALISESGLPKFSAL